MICLKSAFSSTYCPARELGLYQQSVDNAGSIDGKKRNLSVAQAVKDYSAIELLQNHQFELPMDCEVNEGMYSTPAIPHDRDVMPKVQGVM